MVNYVYSYRHFTLSPFGYKAFYSFKIWRKALNLCCFSCLTVVAVSFSRPDITFESLWRPILKGFIFVLDLQARYWYCSWSSYLGFGLVIKTIVFGNFHNTSSFLECELLLYIHNPYSYSHSSLCLSSTITSQSVYLF